MTKTKNISFSLLSTAALENTLRGRFLEAGSLVALFSATNLAESGLNGYCADLVQTIERLKETWENTWFTLPPPTCLAAAAVTEEPLT
jgi:hypothetical protein